MNSIHKYWLCLCLTFVVGQTGFAQAPPPPNPPPPPSAPFTMQQVVEEALAHNPVLLSSLENLLSMKGQEVQAGVRQNPNLYVAGSDITLSANNSASPYAYDVGINRLFERGQKRRWRLDIARNTTAQTDAQYHDQIRQVTLQVKQSFTTLVLAKATLKLAQDNLRDYRHVLQINHDRYDNGDIGKLDYERLDLQLAQFESDESSAEMNLVQASDQLQLLMGYQKPSRTFDITGDIVPPAVPGTLTDLEQKALAARPDYRRSPGGYARSRCERQADLRQWNCGSHDRGRLPASRNLQLCWFQCFHPDTHFRSQPGQQRHEQVSGDRKPVQRSRRSESGLFRRRPGLDWLHHVQSAF